MQNSNFPNEYFVSHCLHTNPRVPRPRASPPSPVQAHAWEGSSSIGMARAQTFFTAAPVRRSRGQYTSCQHTSTSACPIASAKQPPTGPVAPMPLGLCCQWHTVCQTGAGVAEGQHRCKGPGIAPEYRRRLALLRRRPPANRYRRCLATQHTSCSPLPVAKEPCPQPYGLTLVYLLSCTRELLPAGLSLREKETNIHRILSASRSRCGQNRKPQK